MARRLRRSAALLALGCVLAALYSTTTVQTAIQQRGLAAEVQRLAERPFVRDLDRQVIVVTGSSTVRLWRSSSSTFPEAQVVNTGFGGSTMDALAEHYVPLIGRYSPDQVFIGSGDNDLAFGRSPEQIIADTSALLDRIGTELPGTRVAIIAAKPSIQRWYLRDRYEDLNTGFLALAQQRPGVMFVDVWNRLLAEDGTIRPELYADDGLHLNTQGYRIYAAALRAAEELPVLYAGDDAADRPAA